MQVEHHMPSPIRNDSVSQLPYYNMNISRDQTHSAYDQSTITNLTSADTTLPGGVIIQGNDPVSPNHPGQFDV